jgi:hypothetical protein
VLALLEAAGDDGPRSLGAGLAGEGAGNAGRWRPLPPHPVVCDERNGRGGRQPPADASALGLIHGGVGGAECRRQEPVVPLDWTADSRTRTVPALRAALMDYSQLSPLLASDSSGGPRTVGQLTQRVDGIFGAYQQPRFGYVTAQVSGLAAERRVRYALELARACSAARQASLPCGGA